MSNPANQDYMWLRNKYVPERYDVCKFEPGSRQLDKGRVQFDGTLG